MDVKTHLDPNKCGDCLLGAPVNDLQYPPFGERLNLNKLKTQAISMCPSLNLDSATVRLGETTIADEDVTEPNSKSNKENKEIKPKSVKDFKEVGGHQVRRKRTPKSKIAAEYQAWQIPDNKGNTLSIDDLVRFVNGTDLRNLGLGKSNFQSLNCTRKEKFAMSSKKNVNHKHEKEPQFSALQEIQHGCNVVTTESELGSKPPAAVAANNTESFVNINSMTLNLHNDNGVNSRSCLVEISLDDDEFFQVVKRKNRNRKSDTKSGSLVALNRDVRENRNKTTTPIYQSSKDFLNKLSLRNETVLTNDKDSLNMFINRLWMEFQTRYHEYIKEESTRSSKLQAHSFVK